MIKVNFHTIALKDIEDHNVQADFAQELGKQLYMQGNDMEEVELGRTIYKSPKDKPIELTVEQAATHLQMGRPLALRQPPSRQGRAQCRNAETVTPKKGADLYSKKGHTLYSINPKNRYFMIDYKGQLNMGNEALQSEETITANEVLRTQLSAGSDVAIRIFPDIHIKGGNINLARAKELDPTVTELTEDNAGELIDKAGGVQVRVRATCMQKFTDLLRRPKTSRQSASDQDRPYIAKTGNGRGGRRWQRWRHRHQRRHGRLISKP